MATKASQWKSKAKNKNTVLQLPSGNECLARPIRPEAFLESGLIPDALSGIVMTAINSKRGLPPSKMNEIASDPKKLAGAMELFDRALVFCVVEPEVEMSPLCAAKGCESTYTGGDGIHVDKRHTKYHKYVDPERDEEVLYADDVDMEDKQFIFQWAVGGVADADKFRDELGSQLALVQSGEGVGDDTGSAAVD